MKLLIATCLLFSLLWDSRLLACSVLYYVDTISGKIYVANHEDYWYDVDAYIQIMPGSKKEKARLWYGWDDFAQGGINEAGLFFDGAVTPTQHRPEGYRKPRGNLGDDILAKCTTVEEAIDFLENKKVALDNAHMMFGDSTGKAAVIEWINGKKNIVSIEKNHLAMTNFLLSDTALGNYPCYRYVSIKERIIKLRAEEKPASLLQVGNLIGGAAQSPRKDKDQREGGTLYSTIINVTDMEFVLVYQLDNSNSIKMNLKNVFVENKKRKIELE